MNVRGLVLFLTVIMKVVTVRCECVDYLSCLSTFAGNFFDEKDKPPPLDSVIAKNSKSSSIDVSKKELDQILLDVTKFLNEELEVHPGSGFKSTVFRKSHNQTSIYVKTFDIGEDYLENEDEDENGDVKLESSEEIVPKTVNATSVDLNETLNDITTSTGNIKISDVQPSVQFVENVAATTTTTHKTLTRNITKDDRENEIENKDDSYLYYDSNEDNSTDYPIIDYIEYYKDTTNEYVQLEPTGQTISVDEMKDNINSAISTSLHNTIVNFTHENIADIYASNIDEELSSSVFPWIAAIFVKNNTSDEFNYYCDGALLSDTAVLTAARCVTSNNSNLNSDDLLILFGKKSLKIMTDAEKIARVKRIIVHDDFVASKAGNDLAILVTEEPVVFSDSIQAATRKNGELQAEYIATSGWQTTGELTPILLKTAEKGNCGVETAAEDTVCAVYGDDITVCPSYGGLYVTKQSTWTLQGLRTGDPDDRALCFNRNIAFTSLDKHWQWIQDNME